MRPFGSVEFSIEELPAELQVRYVRHAGWIERILARAAVPALMAIGWFWQKPFLVAGAGGGFVVLLIRWAWGHQSVLRVLPDRLVTSAYLWNSTETALSSIETMQWLRADVWSGDGDDNGREGLYISCAGDAANAFFRLCPKNRQKPQPMRSLENFRSTPSTCLFLDPDGLKRLPK